MLTQLGSSPSSFLFFFSALKSKTVLPGSIPKHKGGGTEVTLKKKKFRSTGDIKVCAASQKQQRLISLTLGLFVALYGNSEVCMLTAGPLLPLPVLAWGNQATSWVFQHADDYLPALLFTAQWPHQLHSGFGRIQHFSMTVLSYMSTVTGTGPVSQLTAELGLFHLYLALCPIASLEQQPLHLSAEWRGIEEAAKSWQLAFVCLLFSLLQKKTSSIFLPWGENLQNKMFSRA